MSFDISMDRYVLDDIYGNYMVRDVDVVVFWFTMVKSRFDALLIYYGINHVRCSLDFYGKNWMLLCSYELVFE